MFHKGTLGKLNVRFLDLFFDKHHLIRGKMKKLEKVQVITAWLANSEFKKIQQKDSYDEEDDDDDDDHGDEAANSEDAEGSDDENDVVLLEVGESSDEDGSEEEESEERLLSLNSRTGRPFITYLTRRFYGDSD